MEEWKEIDGWPGYKVSTMGRVMSFRKYPNGKLLKLCPDKDSYYRVTLCNKKNHKTGKIHRLVGIAFIPNPDNLPEIDHIDMNRQNNNLCNLRWVSVQQQQLNRRDTRRDILETDPKERSKICRNQSQQRAIENKKYYCDICDHAFISKRALELHYTSQRHAKNLTTTAI